MQELKLAICNGDLSAVKWTIINKGYEYSVPDPNTGTPLLFDAIAYHQNEIVLYFLEKSTAIWKLRVV